MITNNRSRKGSTIIPAVFLLLFIIMFGATLVKGVLLSTNFSTRTIDKRQAYLLAESATNYICDSLTSSNNNTPLFENLDTLLEGITVGNSVASTVEINTQTVDTKIALMSRVVETSKTTDTYNVTSVATQGNTSQSVTRQMTAVRTQGGIGDLALFGTAEKTIRDAGEYVIKGSERTPSKSIGSVRFENIKSLQCTNFIVDGDLYLTGELKKHLSMKLDNVKITKNLYIIVPEQSKDASIILNNIEVNGNILLYDNGDLDSPTASDIPVIAINGVIKAKNLYVFTKRNVIDANTLAGASSISNIYLSSNITVPNTFKTVFPDTPIYNDSNANTSIKNLYITQSADFIVDTNITEPTNFDFTITGINDWDTLKLDFAKQKVYNISLNGSPNNVGFEGILNVAGSGAVNIFCSNSPYQNYDLTKFSVNHINENTVESTVAVNIIYSQKDGILHYNNGNYPLDANLIVSNGIINISNSSVNGIGICSAYVFNDNPSLGYFFNNKVPWADFGGGLPTLGGKSVTYEYGKYIK